MFQLIEMLAETSRLGAFLFGKLSSESYPKYLAWGSEELLTFHFRCIRKNKKDWMPEVERIFLDYSIFTNQKSKADDQGKRTVLLQAMKKSPYVEIVFNKSTADEKFCRFTKKFVLLLNKCMKKIREQADTVPVQAAFSEMDITNPVEDNQLSFYAEDGNTSSYQSSNPSPPNSGNHLSETEQAVNFISSGENSAAFSSDYDPLDDFFTPFNSLNLSNSAQSPTYESVHSVSIDDRNMQTIREQAITVPVETALSEVNITNPAENNQLSFYAEDGNTSSGQSSNPFTPNGNDLLSKTEQSANFIVSRESSAAFSSNSGPPKDSAIPLNSLNLNNNAQSSACEMFEIHRVSMVGDQVCILEKVAPNFPLPRSEYFLLTWKGATATDE